MKKKLMIAIFLVFPVLAFPKPNVYIQAEGFSMFPWRGIPFHGGTTLYGEVGHGPFAVGFFQYSRWEGKTFSDIKNDELDALVFYRTATHGFFFEFMYSEYNLPSINEWGYSRELGVAVTIVDVYLSPTLSYYRDFGRFNADYFSAKLSRNFSDHLSGYIDFGSNKGQWTEENVNFVDLRLERKFSIFGIPTSIEVGDLYIEEENNFYGILKVSY